MKKAVFLLLVCVVFSSPCMAGSLSKQDLVDNFNKAYATGTVEAFRELYLWENVTPDMAELTEKTIIAGFLALPLASIEIEPLDKKRKTEFIVNGYKYSPNVKLIGYLKLSHDTNGQTGSTSLPFGIHDGQYYLANTIKEKVEGAAVQQQYSVSVFAMPENMDGIKFSGQIEYISNGASETENISGTNNISKSFWADDLTSCVVKRLSGEGKMEVTIYESGKKIFQRNDVISNEDIVYRKGE